METGLSIIIPVYKVEEYIDKCVQSVIAQNYTNYEIILVDDGSPDRCPAICDSYSKNNRNIHVVHKINGGLSDARNAGLQKARKEYILFLDSDDYYDNVNFFNEINDFLQDRKVDMLMYQRKICYEGVNASVTIPEPYSDNILSLSSCDELIYQLSISDQLDASAAMKVIRRNFLIENELYFRTGMVCEDVEWFFRVAPLLQSIGVINSPSYCKKWAMK